jgi:hypothetical protein
MRLHSILLTFVFVALVGCATQFKVTLSEAINVYSGILTFDGPYTGDLAIPKGPGGEAFTGRYVATDMTPGVLSVGGTGQVEARGVWTGRGSRGSTLTAELKVGRGGHGIGTAKDSNGKEYQISF